MEAKPRHVVVFWIVIFVVFVFFVIGHAPCHRRICGYGFCRVVLLVVDAADALERVANVDVLSVRNHALQLEYHLNRVLQLLVDSFRFGRHVLLLFEKKNAKFTFDRFKN